MAVMTPATSANQNSQRRGPVGDPLRPRGGVLRLGDQALDAGQGGVVADGGDLDPQAGVGGDGAGDDRCRLRRGGPAWTRR